MHSSRMRTTHLLPVSPSMHCSLGVPAQGVYLSKEVYLLRRGVPAQGEYLPSGSTCPGGVPAWAVYLPRGCTYPGVYVPRGCTCPGGVYVPRGCTCLGGYLPRYSPVVARQTRVKT